MKSFNFSRNQILALVAIAGIALLGITYGRIRSARPAHLDNSSISVSEPSANGRTEVDAPPVKPSALSKDDMLVVVHVAGCVKHPSVYKLKDGSRVIDAIHAAGGPTAEANLDALNLAAKIKDGEQILLPAKCDIAQTPAPAPIQAAPAAASVPVAETPRVSVPTGAAPQQGAQSVNINTAGLTELDLLPGVGPATAQKILAYRTQIGRFSSVDQLLDVKGIGPKKLDKMRPYIRL